MLIVSKKKVTIPECLGLSRDWRTNRWRVKCPNCGCSFEPETTLRATQFMSCEKCKSDLFADYNATPATVSLIEEKVPITKFDKT